MLARRLGCSPPGGFVAGVVFAGSGFMAAHLIHYSIVCAAAFLPATEGAHGRAIPAWEDGRGLGFDCETSADGLLIIASTWYPGVTATVDGEPVEVLRANVAFCATPLPAGRHRVELIYRPHGLAAGLAVTGLSLLALVVWLWTRGRGRPRHGAGLEPLDLDRAPGVH